MDLNIAGDHINHLNGRIGVTTAEERTPTPMGTNADETNERSLREGTL